MLKTRLVCLFPSHHNQQPDDEPVHWCTPVRLQCGGVWCRSLLRSPNVSQVSACRSILEQSPPQSSLHPIILSLQRSSVRMWYHKAHAHKDQDEPGSIKSMIFGDFLCTAENSTIITVLWVKCYNHPVLITELFPNLWLCSRLFESCCAIVVQALVCVRSGEVKSWVWASWQLCCEVKMEDHHFTTLVQQGCVYPAAQPAPMFLRLFLGFACFFHFNACAIIGLYK